MPETSTPSLVEDPKVDYRTEIADLQRKLDSLKNSSLKMAAAYKGPWATVVSIVPLEIQEYKPGLHPGHFHVDPSSDGDRDIKILHVPVCFDWRNSGLETVQPIRVEHLPSKIADSIVQDYINSQPEVDENSMPGIFFADGQYTADEVRAKFHDKLERSKRLQHNWFIRIIRVADNDWNRYHQHSVISDFQRKVADLLKLSISQHPWISLVREGESKACPFCGSPWNPAFPMCSTCNKIINPGLMKAKESELKA